MPTTYLLGGASSIGICILRRAPIDGPSTLISLPPDYAPKSIKGLAPHRLSNVLSFIDAHIGEKITVPQLAGAANMSPFHFTRMFKLTTGDTPHQYLSHTRMTWAKELLSASDIPIKAVAKAIGYRTQAHFTATFKSSTGLTPKAFRRRFGAESRLLRGALAGAV